MTPTVPIDRATALRNAEKLLRLGRLDQAIAEYRGVADDQPLDWKTANAVCLELRADAGNYRDVAARVHRLAKLQARG